MNQRIPLASGVTDSRKFSSRIRFALLLGTLTVAFQSAHADQFQSPKGAEVFGPQMIIVPPPKKTITIGWSYPVNFETPDLVFKVYSSTNLNTPLDDWSLMTNVPGSCRSAILAADRPQEFFLMTASNYLGESDYAGN